MSSGEGTPLSSPHLEGTRESESPAMQRHTTTVTTSMTGEEMTQMSRRDVQSGHVPTRDAIKLRWDVVEKLSYALCALGLPLEEAEYHIDLLVKSFGLEGSVKVGVTEMWILRGELGVSNIPFRVNFQVSRLNLVLSLVNALIKHGAESRRIYQFVEEWHTEMGRTPPHRPHHPHRRPLLPHGPEHAPTPDTAAVCGESIDSVWTDLETILDDIMRKRLAPGLFRFLALELGSLSIVTMYGGSWTDLGFSLAFGLPIALAEFIPQSSMWYDVFNPLDFMAGVFAAVMASLLTYFYSNICADAVVMSLVFAYLPGASLCMAASRLSRGHTDAPIFMLIVFFKVVLLGSAIALGLRIAMPPSRYADTCGAPTPVWSLFVFILPLALACCVRLGVWRRDMWRYMTSSVLSFVVYQLLAAVVNLDPLVPLTAGAFVAGVFGAVDSNMSGVPYVTHAVPCLGLLAPGSTVVRGFIASVLPDHTISNNVNPSVAIWDVIGLLVGLSIPYTVLRTMRQHFGVRHRLKLGHTWGW